MTRLKYKNFRCLFLFTSFSHWDSKNMWKWQSLAVQTETRASFVLCCSHEGSTCFISFCLGSSDSFFSMNEPRYKITDSDHRVSFIGCSSNSEPHLPSMSSVRSARSHDNILLHTHSGFVKYLAISAILCIYGPYSMIEQLPSPYFTLFHFDHRVTTCYPNIPIFFLVHCLLSSFPIFLDSDEEWQQNHNFT